jgi:ABC-type transport system involved in multi-copper enzyme maturation permease subunit
MDTPKRLHPIIKIAKYTLADEVRRRSFVVMFVICVTLVFLARGCYQGNYMVNGRLLDAGCVVGAVSKATFHLIAVGVMLIAALLSMRAFRRDRDNGMQSSILSKPITRRQYVTGKILGLWALSTLFMLILHVMVFLIASVTLKEVVPGYLAASLLCSFTLLFVVVVVLLLSLFVPDFIAFLCVMGIGVVDLVADGLYALSRSPMAQAMIPQSEGYAHASLSWVTVVHYVWPKLSGAQHFASTFIGGEEFHGFASLYPLINVILYCLILSALLFRRFGEEEII